MCVCVCVCVHACMCVYMYINFTHTCMIVHVCVCVYMRTCGNVTLCVCIYTCIIECTLYVCVGFLLHNYPILLMASLTPSTLHTITKYTSSPHHTGTEGECQGMGHSWVAKALYHNLVCVRVCVCACVGVHLCVCVRSSHTDVIPVHSTCENGTGT